MKLWKSPFGYVNIMIMGRYPENLLNRCVESGMRISRLERRQDGMLFRMRARDMLMLRRAVHGSGCRIRIVGKSCAVRLSNTLRSSACFFIMLAVGAAALYAASFRVWSIRVDCEDVPRKEILGMLEDAGVFIGAAKRDIDLAEAGRQLQWDDRIAYSKLGMSGVCVNVRVNETDKRTTPIQSVCGSSIVAAKDCIIGFISVESGTALVKKGQAVHKGDVLISGDLSALKDGYIVPAKGAILGETAYTVTASAENKKMGAKCTGATEQGASIVFFGREIESASSFIRANRECERNAYLGFGAAVKVCCFTRAEIKETPIPDTPEGTRERAKLAAQAKLDSAVPKEASIISIAADYTDNPDGSVTVLLTATTMEPIGVPTDN